MERIAKELFSMRMMVVALFAFLVSIAAATFVETVHDTQTAKILVYNARWFMILLAYLCVGMIANVFRYNMWQREKIAMLTFHLAFIIMILGAGVSRFWGYEGLIKVAEGQTVDYMFSSEPYLTVRLTDRNGKSDAKEVLTYMSEAVNNDFHHTFQLQPQKDVYNVEVSYINFEKNVVDSLVTNDSIEETAIGLATKSIEPDFLSVGEHMMVGDVSIAYEKKNAMPGVRIWKEGSRYKMNSVMPARSLPMTALQQIRQSGGEVPDSLYTNIPSDSTINLEMATLYNVQGQQFVFSAEKKHTKRMLVKSDIKNEGDDLLAVSVKYNGKSKVINLLGGMQRMQTPVKFEMGGVLFELGYGSTILPLPFQVKCRDFQLDRYLASNAPSSFASELTIIDEPKGVEKDMRLYMNHVIDYRGFRLFQSSYFPDESGTILSVNHDWWGTNISYLGYLLMGIGMVLSIFAPVGRMRKLFGKLIKSSKSGKAGMIALLIAMSSFGAMAQDNVEDHSGHDHSGHDHSSHQEQVSHDKIEFPKPGKMYIMSKEHSEKLSSLLVSDVKGDRIVPIHTLCDKLLRKIYRGQSYKDYNAVQVIIGMHMNRNFWIHEKIIHVSSKGGLREKLGVKDKASLIDLLDPHTGDFKLAELHKKAHRMRESLRGEEEKQVIKLYDRFEVALKIFSRDSEFLKILPKAGDKDRSNWLPIMHHEMESKEFEVSMEYFGALNAACIGKGSFKEADKNLEELKEFQREVGGSEMPSESMVNTEISYNKMNIFKNSMYMYLTFGFLLLIVFFAQTLSSKEKTPRFLKVTGKVLFGALIAVCLYHGAGVLMRSLISGHEPWSNGYEALVFIAWIMVVVGIMMIRINKVVLAGAALLAFFLLFVSDMNLLDPEITPLQPVLKSYWLMIHVAIITASYAPLGIACILGLVNLVLYTVRNKEKGKHLSQPIRDITYINEILITIGIIMLTIGTFLGGVWANESWGRYWGWDPKETWALVAILAYAVILHLRFIPGVSDKFTFNTVSFWGYSTILFTFFGVNFYLVGLHSYANGEGLGEFPSWLVYLGAILYIFTEIASYRNQMYLTKGEAIDPKYFKKKLSILISMIVAIALILVVLRVSDFGTISMNAGIIIGLIAATNAIQYLMGVQLKSK